MKVTEKQKEIMKAYYRKNREVILLKTKIYNARPEIKKRKKVWAKAYQKRYYAIEKNRIRNNTRTSRKVLKMIEELGNKCMECGFDKIYALQIHHVNGKKESKRDFLKKDFDRNNIKLICANCHCKNHYRKNL